MILMDIPGTVSRPLSVGQVNRFKAMVIGGGGIFVAMHVPLYMEEFTQKLNIPTAILGVGARYVLVGFEICDWVIGA